LDFSIATDHGLDHVVSLEIVPPLCGGFPQQKSGVFSVTQLCRELLDFRTAGL